MRFSQNSGEKNTLWYKSFSKGTRKNYLAGQKQLFPHLSAINYSKLTKKLKKKQKIFFGSCFSVLLVDFQLIPWKKNQN